MRKAGGVERVCTVQCLYDILGFEGIGQEVVGYGGNSDMGYGVWDVILDTTLSG
jgi:hypothetical protein